MEPINWWLLAGVTLGLVILGWWLLILLWLIGNLFAYAAVKVYKIDGSTDAN